MTPAPKRATRMRQITFWIPREIEGPFREACREEGKTMSELLRETVDALLNPNGKAPQPRQDGPGGPQKP